MNYTLQSEPGIWNLPRHQPDFFFAGITHLSWIIGSCLFSGIMMLVGGHRTPWCRFQVAQCFVAQLAFILLTGCCGGGFMGVLMMGLGVSTAATPPPAGGGPPPAAMAFGGVLLVFYIVFIAVATIVPWVIGIWGMVTGFQGKDFVIPVVGPWVFRQFFIQYAYHPQAEVAAQIPGVPVENSITPGVPSQFPPSPGYPPPPVPPPPHE